METVKVIVRKSEKPTYWYNNQIGKIFECYQRNLHFQVVETIYGQVRFINAEDCIPLDCIGRKHIKRFKFL